MKAKILTRSAVASAVICRSGGMVTAWSSSRRVTSAFQRPCLLMATSGAEISTRFSNQG